jgi:hypothetical protein
MAEAKEAETKEAETKAKKKSKHKVPDGWLTPVAARHKLVEEGLAPDTLNSAQLYILSRAAKSNGMPVKHFHEDGSVHNERIVDDNDNALTRPGFSWEGTELDGETVGSFRDWWVNRPARGQGGKKKKDEEKSAEDVADESQAEADDEEFDDDDNEDLVEAE